MINSKKEFLSLFEMLTYIRKKRYKRNKDFLILIIQNDVTLLQIFHSANLIRFKKTKDAQFGFGILLQFYGSDERNYLKFQKSKFFDTFEFLTDFEDGFIYYLNVGDDLLKTNNIVVNISREIYSFNEKNKAELRLVR